jgi:hypothetical protein
MTERPNDRTTDSAVKELPVTVSNRRFGDPESGTGTLGAASERAQVQQHGLTFAGHHAMGPF